MISRRTADNHPSTPLEAELAIIWVKPIASLPYVREVTFPTSTWHNRPTTPRGADRLVGYAVHAPPVVTGTPLGATRDRRVFVLKEGDFEGVYADEGPAYPCEAVDPRTVTPGTPGEPPSGGEGGGGR